MPSKKLAVTAFVLSSVGLFGPLLTGIISSIFSTSTQSMGITLFWIITYIFLVILGGILSIISLVKIHRYPKKYSGKGFAVMALTILVIKLLAVFMLTRI